MIGILNLSVHQRTGIAVVVLAELLDDELGH
jgi:hypothetical protein